MLTITASSISELYVQACKELGCSIECINIDIIQKPYNIFGLFKRPVKANVYLNIVKTCTKYHDVLSENTSINHDVKKQSQELVISQNVKNINIINEFCCSEYSDELNILCDIKKTVEEVFLVDKLDISLKDIYFFNKKTIYLKIDGKDCAILIGKNGYRYNALSHLIFTWIFLKYKLFLRLEIGSFLANQNEMIKKYLRTFIKEININRSGDTKVLNGVLIHLAVEHLRCVFPRKIVVIKTNANNESFVRIREFAKNEPKK
jgi:spoIIIJ-associated protein